MSDKARPTYDPFARQPQTLGELHRWMLANAAYQRGTKLPYPVPLNPPPIPGLDRISQYCAAEYGQKLSVETVGRLIGEYGLARGISTAEAEAASFQEVGDVLAPKSKGKKRKRSTEPGEARDKLIAALIKHHQYADGGCLNREPIGNNELARLAKVAESSASAFFDKEFKGHTKYKALCLRDPANLVNSLKLLNQEISPHLLYGRTPPGEGERPDDE